VLLDFFRRLSFRCLKQLLSLPVAKPTTGFQVVKLYLYIYLRFKLTKWAELSNHEIPYLQARFFTFGNTNVAGGTLYYVTYGFANIFFLYLVDVI